MAKVKGTNRVPKIKGKNAPVRSRAARRAASPTEKIDLPIPTTTPQEQAAYVPGQDLSAYQPSPKPKHSGGLTAHSNGNGITKKKKQKPLTRQQRLRREKGLERAEIVMDQKEVAIEKSKYKGRRVQGRRAAWEDLNGTSKLVNTEKGKLNTELRSAGNDDGSETHDDAIHQDSTNMDIEEHGEEDAPDPSAAFVGFGTALTPNSLTEMHEEIS